MSQPKPATQPQGRPQSRYQKRLTRRDALASFAFQHPTATGNQLAAALLAAQSGGAR